MVHCVHPLFPFDGSMLTFYNGLFSDWFWPPCIADTDIIFSSRFFFLSSSFSSPNLSRHRVDVYHTSTHGVALVRIYNAGLKRAPRGSLEIQDALEMWANAQSDGRPAEYRWCPLFNAAKFGWRPLLECRLLECRAATLPRRETRWNLQGWSKLANRSQPLVGLYSRPGLY